MSLAKASQNFQISVLQQNTRIMPGQGIEKQLLAEIIRKLLKTLTNMKKCDKYVRLICNLLKYARAHDQFAKKRYAKLYKELLIVRQVIRWQGLYQVGLQIYQQGPSALQPSNIPNLAFSLLQCFGDILDRFLYLFELLPASPLSTAYLQKLEQLQQNCYFFESSIQLFYHTRTLNKIFKEGTSEEKKNKILKIIKYSCDCITSYCKFSGRVWELSPLWAARIGICSSLIGVYDLLK